MKKIQLELTEAEMRELAEMSALMLSLLGMVKSDLPNARADAWQRLGASLLKAARGLPSIGRDMEINPELRHWFFTPEYVHHSFYAHMLDDVRDALFWNELVTRMADHTLEHATPPEELDSLSEEERHARIASLEGALWHEITHHGLDRLIFMLPEEDS